MKISIPKVGAAIAFVAGLLMFRSKGVRQIPIFPVRGEAAFNQRFDSTHEGIDIFAPHGRDVLASEEGIVRFADEPKGGKVAYLTTADGSQFYYAHLAEFGPQKGLNMHVKAGDVIGFVGDTGNAQGREPHVHFEFRPYGGDKVDPYGALLKATRL